MLANPQVVEYGPDYCKASATGYANNGRLTPKVGSPRPNFEHRRSKRSVTFSLRLLFSLNSLKKKTITCFCFTE